MKYNFRVLFSFSTYTHGLNSTQPNPASEISLIILLINFYLKSMKKLLLCLAVGAFIAVAFSSCASMKKDCQGNKHYKQKGGFYL